MTTWTNDPKTDVPVGPFFLLIDNLAHFLEIDDDFNCLLLDFDEGTHWDYDQKSS